VSGGQLQRLMAAMALITEPQLVILDEPTTALDVTTQIEVLHAFRRVVRERNATAVYVTHDLAVVAQMADRILVLKSGHERETGTTDQIIEAPRDAYTRSLIAAAVPASRPSRRSSPPRPLHRCSTSAISPLATERSTHAESPRSRCSTTSRWRCIADRRSASSANRARARRRSRASSPDWFRPASGQVLFDGRSLPQTLEKRTRDDLRRIQIVFQMADTALNPAQSIRNILARPLELYLGSRATS
jgi:peptide/nickel transport system ATP-binding protein